MECPWCHKEMLYHQNSGCVVEQVRIGGELLDRIPYKQETRGEFVPVRCHDCGVGPGELHHPQCDVAECPRCHGQEFACGCGLRWVRPIREKEEA